jgi:A/G-specific adenine glycosylase
MDMFIEALWAHYSQHGRSLPWRQPGPEGNFDPYCIMVSEIMLQQTQVTRVMPKYQLFLQRFPDTQTLAGAKLGEVLQIWSGLGYNRRAKFLHQAAQAIVSEHNSAFPKTLNTLTKLPGIGKNTAGAILAYAFNQPVVFVETNIRTVYIHHFFDGHDKVSDTEILELVAATLDKASPREFYWALMDYGTHLKASQGNIARRSSHYSKQSVFQGSKRQIRGRVLKLLTEQDLTEAELQTIIGDGRLEEVLQSLLTERLITKSVNDSLSLF